MDIHMLWQFNRIKKRRRCEGMTLISLLVGSMISILIVITGLTFYKYHIQISMGNAQISGYTAKIRFLLSVIESEVANAGYGHEFGTYDANNLFALLPTTAEKQGIVWIFNENPKPISLPVGTPHTDVFHCRGIVEEIQVNPTNNQKSSTIQYVEAPIAVCNDTALLTSLAWETIEPVVAFEGPQVNQYLQNNPFLLDFATQRGECMPFGLADADTRDRTIFTLQTVSFTGLTDPLIGDVERLRLETCLPNVR